MINPFKEVEWRPTTAQVRSFAKSLVVGFPCLAVAWMTLAYAITGTWPFDLARKLAMGGAGAGLLFWVLPVLARPFYLAWYFLACCVGLVVGNVLMAAVYYGMVTPTGWMLRIFRGPAVRTAPDRGAETYWQECKPPPGPERYFRQF